MSVADAESRSIETAEAAFCSAHSDYAGTAVLDELRAHRVSRAWTRGGHVYLDYTGGGLYAESQLREHMALLRERRVRQPAFDQPHLSREHAARRARARRGARVLQRLARRVRRDLHAQRDRCAEARRRGLSVRAGDRFLLTFDNHNSVNGIREFARARGAETTYVPASRPTCASTRRCSALPRPHPRRAPQPVRLPGAVQLLRRAASAGVDRRRPTSTAGMCCSTPPRSCPPTAWT